MTESRNPLPGVEVGVFHSPHQRVPPGFLVGEFSLTAQWTLHSSAFAGFSPTCAESNPWHPIFPAPHGDPALTMEP